MLYMYMHDDYFVDLVRLFWGFGFRPAEAVFRPCWMRCFGLISTGCFGVRLSPGEVVFWPCLVRCFGLISSGCFGVRPSSG